VAGLYSAARSKSKNGVEILESIMLYSCHWVSERVFMHFGYPIVDRSTQLLYPSIDLGSSLWMLDGLTEIQFGTSWSSIAVENGFRL